jgi:IstB-like ATP binding protein
MTDQITDAELAQIEQDARARLGSAPPRPAPPADDIARAIEQIRVNAARHNGSPHATDAVLRHIALRPVLDSLPSGARKATRSELEKRISPRALKAVEGWQWGGGNIVLMGATGTGKTSAAAHLVRRLCFEAAVHGGAAFGLAQFIRWQSCRALSEVARETRLGTGTPEAVTRCQYARLLVLNDLGPTDDRATVERILDDRYERGWPTVTTTGLCAAELEHAFGDALARRIFECGPDRGTYVELSQAAE